MTLIPRYSHPLITELWSDVWTYNAWLTIERRVLDAQITLGIMDWDRKPLLRWLAKVDVNEEAASEIRALECRTKHDVVAFLEWLRHDAPDNGKYIHYGLTSSDLVDTAQALRFLRLHGEYLNLGASLVSELNRLALDDTIVPGYTHGELAEPTSMRIRASHWLATVEHPLAALSATCRQMRRMKLSGPVGTFAHNPPEVEARVAVDLGLFPQGPGSSQIVPRTPLALWASAAGSLAAACSKIATDIRLLHMLNEVGLPQEEGQIGSSSMAHKNNPIQAEQVCGLARVANGYASMLQSVDGWLERDIAHSSVERIAVPDLWHVLFRVMRQTSDLLSRVILVGEGEAIAQPELWVHKMTLDTLSDAESIEEARESALIGMTYNDRGGIDPTWFIRNYPTRRPRRES